MASSEPDPVARTSATEGEDGLVAFTTVQVVCWLIASLLSLVGSLWLLYRLHQLGGWVGRRVFPKQLLSLGAANVFLSGGVLVYVIVYSVLVGGGTPFDPNNDIFGWFSLWCGMRFVAVFQEAQIATVLLYQACRWHRLVCFFGHWAVIPAIWIGGFALGVIDLLFHAANSGTYPGSVCVAQNPRDPIKLVVLLAAFLMCIVSNVAMACRAWGRSPSTVVRAAFKRAAAYPANFLLCYFLTLLGALWPAIGRGTGYKTVQYTLEFLSGAFNAAAYAWTYRYALSLRKGHPEPILSSPRVGAQRGHSVDVVGPVEVNIHNVDIIEFIPNVEGEEDVLDSTLDRATTTSNVETNLTASGASLDDSSRRMGSFIAGRLVSPT